MTSGNMIDIKFIRENPEKVKQNILDRQLDPKKIDVDKLLSLDQRRLELMRQIDKIRTEVNLLSSQLKDAAKRTPEKIDKGKNLKASEKKLSEELNSIEKEWQELMDWIPNVVSSQMPVGKDSTGNREIKAWPKENPRPKFNFSAKHYHDLMTKLDLVDTQKAAKNSGSRFYYLKNEGALLQFALMNYAFLKLVEKGFIPMITPSLVKYRPLYGTGYFPSESTQIYKINDEEKLEEKEALYLVGTSEQAIVSYHSDEVIEIDDSHPLRYVGYSECFRSEAGSWGKDTKGIKRVHEFAKVEMIYFTTPETSGKYMQEALSIEEEILQELNLPYRVIDMCTGDVGLATYRKFDTEVWLPSQQEYCEVMSNSDLASYHTRRLHIKYQDKKTGEKKFAHTISATAITNTRPILAIIDNYQKEDGNVFVPNVLKKYIGTDAIKPRK